MSPHATTIHAVLFATAEQHSIDRLAEILGIEPGIVETALVELDTYLKESGIMLVRQGNEVTLATHSDQSTILETIRKEELSKELSKASAETLAVIIYHPEVSKAEIELVRGVNSAYSLRALQVRGLIEQVTSGRTARYRPTLALLEHFGVSNIEDLPAYTETVQKIQALLSVDTEQLTTE